MGYRMMIADDEPKIIQLIRQLGHWQELGIEIIAECSNGEEALSCIQREKPDFVLSDIKMPVYDGIELIRRTRESGLETLFVLLSGYRHFEYARSAIQLNVMDYLLKPIDEKQLNETLEKVCRRIDQMRRQKEQNDTLTTFRSKEEEQRQETFWNMLLSAKPDDDAPDADTIRKDFGYDFPLECFQVLCLVSNLNGMLEHNDSLFREKVDSFIESNFSGIAKFAFFTTYRGYIIILNFRAADKIPLKQKMMTFYYNIRDLSEIYGQFALNIGCSRIKTGSAELIRAFHEAQAAEWSRLILLQNGVLEYSQTEQQPHFALTDLITEQETQTLLACLKYLRDEELGILFGLLYERAQKLKNANPMDMKYSYDRLQDMILPVIAGENRERAEENLFYAYLEARTYPQLLKELYQLLDKYLQERRQQMKEKKRKPISVAAAYISQHFKEPLSLDEVAEKSNVSPTYLSKLFKDEMEIGFNEYLNKVRIEESEKLLAQTTHTIKEIAEMTGYGDEKYYSRTFKKVTGIKPSDYRRLYS